MDNFKKSDDFWEEGKHVKYFEHKTDSYKNNKRKIFTFNKGFIFMETPYKIDNQYFGFEKGEGKQINEDILSKFYKEITRSQFFEKQITHLPIN